MVDKAHAARVNRERCKDAIDHFLAGLVWRTLRVELANSCLSHEGSSFVFHANARYMQSDQSTQLAN